MNKTEKSAINWQGPLKPVGEGPVDLDAIIGQYEARNIDSYKPAVGNLYYSDREKRYVTDEDLNLRKANLKYQNDQILQGIRQSIDKSRAFSNRLGEAIDFVHKNEEMNKAQDKAWEAYSNYLNAYRKHSGKNYAKYTMGLGSMAAPTAGMITEPDVLGKANDAYLDVIKSYKYNGEPLFTEEDIKKATDVLNSDTERQREGMNKDLLTTLGYTAAGVAGGGLLATGIRAGQAAMHMAPLWLQSGLHAVNTGSRALWAGASAKNLVSSDGVRKTFNYFKNGELGKGAASALYDAFDLAYIAGTNKIPGVSALVRKYPMLSQESVFTDVKQGLQHTKAYLYDPVKFALEGRKRFGSWKLPAMLPSVPGKNAAELPFNISGVKNWWDLSGRAYKYSNKVKGLTPSLGGALFNGAGAALHFVPTETIDDDYGTSNKTSE